MAPHLVEGKLDGFDRHERRPEAEMARSRYLTKAPFGTGDCDTRGALESAGGRVDLTEDAAHDFGREILARQLDQLRQVLAPVGRPPGRAELAHLARESRPALKASQNVQVGLGLLAAQVIELATS